MITNRAIVVSRPCYPSKFTLLNARINFCPFLQRGKLFVERKKNDFHTFFFTMTFYFCLLVKFLCAFFSIRNKKMGAIITSNKKECEFFFKKKGKTQKSYPSSRKSQPSPVWCRNALQESSKKAVWQRSCLSMKPSFETQSNTLLFVRPPQKPNPLQNICPPTVFWFIWNVPLPLEVWMVYIKKGHHQRDICYQWVLPNVPIICWRPLFEFYCGRLEFRIIDIL